MTDLTRDERTRVMPLLAVTRWLLAALTFFNLGSVFDYLVSGAAVRFLISAAAAVFSALVAWETHTVYRRMRDRP